jgi:hypothetical protein
MPNQLKNHQKSLLGAAVLILVSWFVPGLHLLALPMQYLYTHLHELGHALAAVVTGGSVMFIHVYADGSGVTQAGGGSVVLIASGGYVGATAFGAAMIAMSAKERGARWAIGLLGGVLLVGSVLWLRGDLVGIITGFGSAGLLLFAAGMLRAGAAVFLAQFLGLYQCLGSLQALFSIFGAGMFHREHDAQLLEKWTGIPAILSASVWTLVSLALVWATLKIAWKGTK